MKKLLLTTMCMLGLAACANGSNKENNTKKENTMKTIALTKADFLTKVANYETNPTEWKYLGDKPALIDFYASWCGPCKALAPVLEELAAEYGDSIYIYKVNTEEEQELAAAFGIRSIPTLLFIPTSGKPPDRTGCPAQGVAQGGHRQGTAQQVDRHGTHRRQSPLPAEPPVPAADGLPRRGDHTIGIRTSGHRPGEVYRMRQMRRALRQTGHTQTGRQWKNCVGSASCNGLSTGSKRHSNAHTGSA